ncbi:transposase [Corallococcus terminator]|uniref:Transposase n=1 Tax=Corallococcus terminator TaxID=2316733 RepID=A0A3A8HJ33_9BACT|nr:transposase [Corallococcus terminator]RKG70466.1 transposase [Corallococcus terminator]
MYPRREARNTIRYVTRTCVPWRDLPHNLPDWQSVYRYFRLWKKDGTWERVHDALRGKASKAVGREQAPTAGIMDSRGYDAGKQVKGRKRHPLVDGPGLVLVAWVTATDVQNQDASAGAVLPRSSEKFPR